MTFLICAVEIVAEEEEDLSLLVMQFPFYLLPAKY